MDASVADLLYCVHGHEIEILLDDYNEVYVPLSQLSCLGFKLYQTKGNLDKMTYDKLVIIFL